MMQFKYVPGSVLLVLTLISCSNPKEPIKVLEEIVYPPIVAVKIDDTNGAHPQIGIDKADIVYIEQVEGGLIRLVTIFSKEIPTKIGPVRSARISDLDLLAQFGKVAFFYSGAQSKLIPLIQSADLFDFGANHESATLYTRDPSRFAPFNMVLSGEEVKKRILDLDIARADRITWKFGKLTRKGKAISSVKVHWPAANYTAKWNKSSWDLYHNGSADLTSENIQISPTTFVIQKVVISNSEYKDKVGGVTPFSATVGQGSGWVLRSGVAIKALWNRPDELSATTWSDIDGNEINFAKGPVWIALTDQEPEFTPAPVKK